MSLLAASVPPVTQEFYERLVRSFTPAEVVPNVTTKDDVMYSAGEQNVIRWIRQHVRGSTITSPIVKPNDP